MPDLPKTSIAGGKLLFACLLLIGLSTPGTAAAQEFCSEPVQPYCLDLESEYDTMLQINRCEDDLNDYQQQLDEYEQCIADQLDSLRKQLEDARKALGDARENF